MRISGFEMKKGITNSLWYESYLNKRTVWEKMQIRELEGLQERTLGCVHCDGQAGGFEAIPTMRCPLELQRRTPWRCLLEN